MASEVTLLIKGATLLPAPGMTEKMPELTLLYQQDADSSLSSDKYDDLLSCAGSGMVFDTQLTMEKLSRTAPGNLTVSFSETVVPSKTPLGKGVISMADLIKHADFVTGLRDQAIVLKHAQQPCPIRIDIAGGLLDGAMLSIEVQMLTGSKVRGRRGHACIEASARSASPTLLTRFVRVLEPAALFFACARSDRCRADVGDVGKRPDDVQRLPLRQVDPRHARQ